MNSPGDLQQGPKTSSEASVPAEQRLRAGGGEDMGRPAIVPRSASEGPQVPRLTGALESELSRGSRFLGSLVRRAAKWGWREVYEQIRRGEDVRPFHRAMVEITLQRIKGQKPPQPEGENE